MADNGGFGLSPHVNAAGGVRRPALDAIDAAIVDGAARDLGAEWRDRLMLKLDVGNSVAELGAAADQVAQTLGIFDPAESDPAPSPKRAKRGTWVSWSSDLASVVDNWAGSEVPPPHGNNKNYRWSVRLYKAAGSKKKRSVNVAAEDDAQSIGKLIGVVVGLVDLWRLHLEWADPRTRRKAIEICNAVLDRVGLRLVDGGG